MSRIVMEIPDESFLALKLSEKQAEETLRMAAAAKLFEMNRLSSETAAHLAGVPLVVFLSRLADYEVDTFRLNSEDIQREQRLA
jgi:predicted HTH domain antitoxin